MVIALLATTNYGFLSISIDDGSSAKMWATVCKTVKIFFISQIKKILCCSVAHYLFIIFRCWISNPIIHQAVNISYYAVVFVFTFGILITVPQIVRFTPATGKIQHNHSVKKNCFSVLSLLCLLGVTWAFAFFSFGALLLASYYIFSILNSFQGRSIWALSMHNSENKSEF